MAHGFYGTIYNNGVQERRLGFDWGDKYYIDWWTNWNGSMTVPDLYYPLSPHFAELQNIKISLFWCWSSKDDPTVGTSLTERLMYKLSDYNVITCGFDGYCESILSPSFGANRVPSNARNYIFDHIEWMKN